MALRVILLFRALPATRSRLPGCGRRQAAQQGAYLRLGQPGQRDRGLRVVELGVHEFGEGDPGLDPVGELLDVHRSGVQEPGQDREEPGEHLTEAAIGARLDVLLAGKVLMKLAGRHLRSTGIQGGKQGNFGPLSP